MHHGSYIRQVLLTGLLAPAALAASLVLLGPTWQRLRTALRRLPARVFFCAIWAHALLAAASLLWTSNLDASLDRAVVLISLALWGSGWLLAGRAGHWRGLVGAVLAVAGVVAFVGACRHLGQVSLGTAPARLSAPIGNANTVAVLMFLPIVAAVAILLRSARDASRWPWPGVGALGMGGFAALAFYFAWSRSGMAGLGAALLALLTVLLVRLCRRLGRSRAWALVPLGVVLLGLGAAATWVAASPERSSALFDRVRLSSLGARYYGSMASWEIFKENPIGGAGAGTFLSEAPRRILRDRYAGSYGKSFLNLAHNEYAETGQELGTLGLLAFLAVLGGALVGAWRGANRSEDPLERSMSAALFAGVAGVAVSSLADPSFRYWDFTITFYAAAALAAAGGGSREAEQTVAPLPCDADGLRVRRLLVVFAGMIVAGCSCWLWAFPDMYREMSRLEARRASRRGDHEAATGAYRVAVRGNGYFLSRVLAHYNWIYERVACGRGEEALEIAEELNRVMPDCPQVLRQLAEARIEVGDSAGALGAMVDAGRRDPYSRSFPEDLLKCFKKSPVPDAKILVKVGEGRPKLSAGETAVLLSMAAAARKAWPEALGALEGVDPDEVEFVALELWRGLVFYRAGMPREAVKALEAHVKRHRLHAHGYWHLALARRSLAGGSRTDAEVAALRSCLKYDLEHESARLRLVSMLAADKCYDEALAILMPYLPIARRKASFIIQAARIHQLQGRHGQGRRLLEAGFKRTKSPKIKKLLEAMRSSRH
jgi:O-antigen ligase/tetratricopeptide (TPR) repeat protein